MSYETNHVGADHLIMPTLFCLWRFPITDALIQNTIFQSEYAIPSAKSNIQCQVLVSCP